MNRYAEDELPSGQSLIETTNLRRFHGGANLLLDPGCRYPTMATTVGPAGSGKTISVQSFLRDLPLRDLTGLPAAVGVKVRPRSTPKTLTEDIVAALEEKVKGTTSFKLATEAVEIIKRNDLKLLIIDEADWLSADSFDVLRHIHDRSGCPVLLVGLPRLLSVIDAQEKFSSRIGLRLQFSPPPVEEVLNTILPGLVFPHWQFDPDEAGDRDLGEYIWRAVHPSLRKLRNLLQIASLRVQEMGEERISQATIDQSLRLSATEAEMRRIQQESAKRSAGSHEAESERRQAAKLQRRHNGKSV